VLSLTFLLIDINLKGTILEQGMPQSSQMYDGTVESHLNVVPLLETVDDLIAGPKIMDTLFKMDVYRNHLKIHGDSQEIMLGYSDGFCHSVRVVSVLKGPTDGLYS
jgi:phosphoenolpyruvate carboxylase